MMIGSALTVKGRKGCEVEMTKQEAIETIRIAIARVEWEFPMDYAEAFDIALKALSQPEIIRCKDCKNKEKDGISEGFHYCNINGLQVTDDWFCADGERR